MDAKRQMRFDARAKVVKAMAHATRLFILTELEGGERCVCELTEMVGADVSTVSKHLTVLKNAGLVEDEKRGLQVFYRLRCPCILEFLGCVETVLRTNARAQRAVIR